MAYDPSQFTGTARYYLRGRPPYSDRLADVLVEELTRPYSAPAGA